MPPTSEIYFFTVLEARGPKSGWLYSWVLVRALFLACRWPCSYCILTWQRLGRAPIFSLINMLINPIRKTPRLSPQQILNVLSYVWLFVTPWTAASRAPLCMGFPTQEYWSGLPFPFPGIFLTHGSKLMSLTSPALAGRFFSTAPLEKPPVTSSNTQYVSFHYQIPSHCRVGVQLHWIWIWLDAWTLSS